MRAAVVLVLLVAARSSPLPGGKQAKQRTGSCSKEDCAAGRQKQKISADCIRAPFCVRQVS